MYTNFLSDFQAEHLGATSKNDKICKLCGYVGSNMGPLRKHLLTKHSIDLETPTACLVEPEHCRSGSSSPLPSSSSEKKSLNLNTKHNFANNNNNNSSPSVSIIRTSVVTTKVEDSITSSSTPERRPSPPANVIVHEAPGYFVKQEIHCNTGDDVIEEVAKDLSIKKIKRPGSPSIDLTKKKRHKTERKQHYFFFFKPLPILPTYVRSGKCPSLANTYMGTKKRKKISCYKITHYF